MMMEKMHFLRKLVTIVWKLIIFQKKNGKFWKIFLGETYYIFAICKVLKIKFELVTCNFILPLSLFPFLFSSLFFPPFH